MLRVLSVLCLSLSVFLWTADAHAADPYQDAMDEFADDVSAKEDPYQEAVEQVEGEESRPSAPIEPSGNELLEEQRARDHATGDDTLNPYDVEPGKEDFPVQIKQGQDPQRVPVRRGHVSDPDDISVDEGIDSDSLTVHEGELAPIKIEGDGEHAPVERGEVDDPDDITVDDGTDPDDITVND